MTAPAAMLARKKALAVLVALDPIPHLPRDAMREALALPRRCPEQDRGLENAWEGA